MFQVFRRFWNELVFFSQSLYKAIHSRLLQMVQKYPCQSTVDQVHEKTGQCGSCVFPSPIHLPWQSICIIGLKDPSKSLTIASFVSVGFAINHWIKDMQGLFLFLKHWHTWRDIQRRSWNKNISRHRSRVAAIYVISLPVTSSHWASRSSSCPDKVSWGHVQ